MAQTKKLAPEIYDGKEKKEFYSVGHEDRVEEALRNGEICRGEVSQVEKDKAYIEWEGVRGIIPKEELDFKGLKGLIGFVGRQVNFIIKGYDKEAQIFVASRKDALELMKTTTLEQLKVGDVRAGSVIRVESWGCIMDLGGVLGRLSVADMLHTYIADANEVVEKGDYFDVVIKKIGRSESGEDRITLSLKDLIPDAWSKVKEKYKVQMVSKGIVTGFFEKGTERAVFIELEEGIEGLADMPEIPLAVGQAVRAQIKNINPEKKRIKLRVVGIVR